MAGPTGVSAVLVLAPIVIMVAITAVLATAVGAVGDTYGPIAGVALGLVGAAMLVLIARNRVFESDERARLRSAFDAARRGFAARA